MAEIACEGSIYSIDLRNGKPPHYWIVLNAPRVIDGGFAVVSFTDRHNLNRISDVWEYGYELCSALKLSKPSVVAVNYAAIKTQTWLDEFGAKYVGHASSTALFRARCNLYWYHQFLNPTVSKLIIYYASIWNEKCGPVPLQM